MKLLFNAESMPSVLAAVVLFSVIALSYSQWQSQQNAQMVKRYQEQQAWLIAENQITLDMVGDTLCGKSIRQNELLFKVECSLSEIKVAFPLGEIVLEKP